VIRQLIIIGSLILASCTTHHGFTRLPDKEEYSKPKSYLKDKYTDISLYEDSFRGFDANFPKVEYLLQELGEPDKIEYRWSETVTSVALLIAISADPFLWGAMFALRPVPSKIYTYKKGNYCIRANINYGHLNDISDHMTYWRWEEGSENCL